LAIDIHRVFADIRRINKRGNEMRLHSSLNRTERAARIHYYKSARARNPETPVLALWIGALRELHFRETLSRDVAEHKRRSKAAKRGWKQRRVNEMEFV
jgi:hypothetical protein